MNRSHSIYSQASALLTRPFRLVRDRFWRAGWAGAYEVGYAARVSVWLRWLIIAMYAFMYFERTFSFPASQNNAYGALLCVLIVFNGLVHFRLWSGRPLTWRWMLALSAADVVLVTAAVWISGGFSTLFSYLMYYPALALFAVLFTSWRLNLVWVSLVALAYTLTCLMAGDGIDLADREEMILLARVAVMYTVALAVNLVARYERAGRLRATERESALQQERIDLSQSIHDTAAQSVYMIGLGVDSARKLAGDTNAELSETLEATSQLSQSVMWELRRPIDAGRLFEGRDLGTVLRAHTETFQRITTVSTRMKQRGVEPYLGVDTRSRLFSIAHNALTNAFRHADASNVYIMLDFEGDCISLK
ncbi:MAG: hypothetical protein F4Z35_04360, partial [Dehalococcoidia bacterium]|nr:hypothetical protein [Dehalococcoidia bacterium]